MREILSRGKRLDDGEWVEGSLLRRIMKDGTGRIVTYICPDVTAIYYDGDAITYGPFYKVDPSTVGQDTGLTDKNGKRIFDGDIVRVTDDDDEVCDHSTNSDTGIGVVEFVCGLWYVGGHDSPNNGLWDLQQVYYIEVIGNIHDDKELLERGRE